MLVITVWRETIGSERADGVIPALRTGTNSMTDQRFQQILADIQKPSRYIGTEVNRVCKDPGTVELHVALAFPDLYEIGTSHFGLQILYDRLNREDWIGAERVFAPDLDLERRLIDEGLALCSLENRIPLYRFDMLGFSLLYELNYSNVVTILHTGRIPLFQRDRDERHPLVIAGGPCTCNPEPLAEVFDAMVIGDGEVVLSRMCAAWRSWRRVRRAGKIDLLRSWAGLGGVYVPSLYRVRSTADGGSRVEPCDPAAPERVRASVVSDLDAAGFPVTPVIPYGKPVHDRLRLEIARGCTRGCRFCQAGMIYRPVRERSPQGLVNLAERALSATGYDEVSLLSLSSGDYSAINQLIQALMQRCANDRIAVSLPSLRAGTLTPELMRQIKRVRKTGFTIAPEAGSERLRAVINKNISEADIFFTVENAFSLGWRLIKMYFMIGLPTETTEDLAAIVDLTRRLSTFARKINNRARMTVSVTPFVPKPHTPFQWVGQLQPTAAAEKLAWLQRRLGDRHIQFKSQDPQVSLLEGVWSRGDRRLTDLLMEAHRLGCRFDGWSDHFDADRWQRAMERRGIDAETLITRERPLDEPLPWDHIDYGVTTVFLQDEWRAARSGRSTGDCRTAECNRCGACDFINLEPVVHPPPDRDLTATQRSTDGRPQTFHTIRVIYSKTATARFLGHLEVTNVVLRALRRAGVALQYSQGFHPMPKIATANPLPLGVESLCEEFTIGVETDVTPALLKQRLNHQLPEGLTVLACRAGRRRQRHDFERWVLYHVRTGSACLTDEAVERFNAMERCDIQKKRKNGKIRTIDLKRGVASIQRLNARSVRLALCDGPACTVRPADVLAVVFNLTPQQIQQARIIKIGAA